jgi:hypothetical protein
MEDIACKSLSTQWGRGRLVLLRREKPRQGMKVQGKPKAGTDDRRLMRTQEFVPATPFLTGTLSGAD